MNKLKSPLPLFLLFTICIVIFSSHTFAGRYDGITKIIRHGNPPIPRTTSPTPAPTPPGAPPSNAPVTSSYSTPVEKPSIPSTSPSFNYHASPPTSEFNRAGGKY
jgi:hypothetical protein